MRCCFVADTLLGTRVTEASGEYFIPSGALSLAEETVSSKWGLNTSVPLFSPFLAEMRKSYSFSEVGKNVPSSTNAFLFLLVTYHFYTVVFILFIVSNYIVVLNFFGLLCC